MPYREWAKTRRPRPQLQLQLQHPQPLATLHSQFLTGNHSRLKDMAILHIINGSRLLSTFNYQRGIVLETNRMKRPPKRDWRDWFIMATVMGGVGYGLYTVTKVSSCPSFQN